MQEAKYNVLRNLAIGRLSSEDRHLLTVYEEIESAIIDEAETEEELFRRMRIERPFRLTGMKVNLTEQAVYDRLGIIEEQLDGMIQDLERSFRAQDMTDLMTLATGGEADPDKRFLLISFDAEPAGKSTEQSLRKDVD